MIGEIFLVGFGPGDPELLTIKAEKTLRKADIILFDDLVDSKYIRKFRAKKIYVGKRAKKHGLSQDKINEMLYQLALTGKTVVRLKGGDPFIFGRGGEELNYLRSKNIPVCVIPGITAALAAAACAGIPLTQRAISSSVAFCVGRPKEKPPVPNTQTIVYYMPGQNIRAIARALILNHWKPSTPVAFVRDASLKTQKISLSTLRRESKKNSRVASPFVMIVGETV